MEYWDSKGQIYNDNAKQLTPQEKAYNKILSASMKVFDWANETNPESKILHNYKMMKNISKGDKP